MPAQTRPRQAAIEGWIRKLEGERLEIFLKAERMQGAPDRKIRASGPADEMLELVEKFEGWTGLRVNSPVLPKRRPKPFPGSMSMFEVDEFDLVEPTTAQLQSGDNDA